MAQRRFHYDQAFEHYLRSNAIAYVAVDEARRALTTTGDKNGGGKGDALPLKSFDFVVYSKNKLNLLVDVKGRKHSGRTGSNFQNWVTADDVDSLGMWEGIFGEGFAGAFAFLFWCEAQPPDALFHEIFEFGGRWYAVLAVGLKDYRRHMTPRSPKWGTVNIPSKAFSELSQPLKDLL